MDSNLEKLINETVIELLDHSAFLYANDIDPDDSEGGAPLSVAAEKVVSHVWQCEKREQRELLSAAIHAAVIERLVSRLWGSDVCTNLERLIDDTVTDFTDRKEIEDLYDVIGEKTAVRLKAAQEKVVARISKVEEPARHGLLSAAVYAAIRALIIEPLDEENAQFQCEHVERLEDGRIDGWLYREDVDFERYVVIPTEMSEPWH